MSTKKKKGLTPLFDRVLVKPIDPATESKGSSIIIPDTAEKERPQKGKVIAVGDGRRNDSGDLVPVSIKPGQVVVFSKYGPTEIEVDGMDYYILSESDILAIEG